jgi:hypothetical protein
MATIIGMTDRPVEAKGSPGSSTSFAVDPIRTPAQEPAGSSGSVESKAVALIC